MKKRVSSILLAAVLCVTMLSVVALATECADGAHTYDENLWAPNANGISHSPRCDKCEHVRENLTIQHYDINRDGICDACRVGLGAYLGNSPAQGGCFTTLQGALDYAGNERDSITVNPIRNQESVTYSGKNTQVTLNLAGVTINELKVTSGKLTITGNGRVTKLEVSGDTVQLSGGTYGEITGVTDKNTLLGPGYVFDTDGKTVVEAPIKSVTASVRAHNNAKYGYTAEQAPVLTATVAPDNATGVTYQWYKVNGSEKTAIDNATAQTYTVETGLNAGDYDYCCTATVETVVLLSHKKPDSHINIKVEFGEGEGKVPLKAIAERAEAYKPKERVTYKMIKEYIEAKYGFKVHTAYIAEVKRDLGLPMYDAPNAVEELKQPRKHPTAEKVEAIKDALKHFEVI